MQTILYADLSKKFLTDSSAGTTSVSLPKITQGDKLHIGMRFLETTDGNRIEVTKNLVSLRASVGYFDARPESGYFVLRLGSAPYTEGINQTEPIAYNATARAVQNSLSAIGLGGATVINTDGSWIISNDGQEIEDLSGSSVSGLVEALRPLSFVRVRQLRSNGAYHYDIRLTQAPLASTVDFSPILPAVPTVTRIQEGGYDEWGSWPEIQAIKILPTFRGTYIIRRKFRRTTELSIEDGAEQLQDALNTIRDPGGTFEVTNPRTNVAHVTFLDGMKGIPQELLEIAVTSNDSGDPTFTLDFNTVEIAEALRAEAEVTTYLEVEATFDEEGTYTTTSLCKMPITIERELNWEGLEAASNIDWLRPPYGETYVPFTKDQILFGTQNYSINLPAVVEELQEIKVTHNLNTKDVHVSVYDHSDGDLLIEPHSIRHETENILILSFANLATEGQYRVVISTAGSMLAFQEHTHTIAQIINLSTTLDSISDRLTTLEAMLVVVGPGSTNKDPSINDLVLIESESLDLSIPSSSATVGGRPVLLGAIHNAAPLVAIPPFTADVFTKQVRQIDSPWLIPAGRNRRAWPVQDNGYVASNGSIIYEVRKDVNSYYPVEYEQDLFMFWIEANMLPPQRTLTVNSEPEFKLNGNTRANYMLEVSFGQLVQESGEGYGPNLEKLDWATPVISQRVLLTSAVAKHPFKVNIYRNTDGEVATSTTIYGRSYNCTPPVALPFAVRARMLKFDTENREGTRGVINIKMKPATITVS